MDSYFSNLNIKKELLKKWLLLKNYEILKHSCLRALLHVFVIIIPLFNFLFKKEIEF